MTGHRPPHLEDRPTTTSRKGFFFVPGDIVQTPAGTVQKGSAYVEWEAHEHPAHSLPIVFVHGGGGQGTDFKGTPDGRPGWFDHVVDAGYAAYNLDRPGHGRSPRHPDVLGSTRPPFSYEFAQRLFARGEASQTQWVGEPVVGDPVFDQYMASSGALASDLAASQALDGDRVARLLDVIGPAVLVTHSAGAPAGWFAAARRPGLVRAIVAIEPFGPPFADVGGLGELTWGLTYEPLDAEASITSARFREAVPRLRAFEGLPIAVVVGSASQFVEWAPATAEFLRELGAAAEVVDLGDHGVRGNGHGLIFEANSAEALVPVLDWIVRAVARDTQWSAS
ncbi:alpha/beta fold hydrolase [Herbiconiux sp. CPCC 203407]|uniref:Alpha/beta fold hydrolase n=1 Tax=Herbiconiux oxytropis TaxID=2970915 RepID=A0AA41XFA0_9MICO|nr:alpha/beta fold hydrolase [Herbiconiux oxytropis]MCS5721568.1 alpha/beta fold hydrolase [Herbiconiux oxytropis]MCS5724645.1 alpha/beta fold hydrolase [Herbiconiux oxytropis]